MIEGLFLMAVLFGIGAVFPGDSFAMVISFQNHQIYLSVFTFAGLIVGLMWLWAFILLPFKWIRRFFGWRQKSKEQQKQAYLAQVLEALVNHNKEQYPLLVKQASAHFTSQDGVGFIATDRGSLSKASFFPDNRSGGNLRFFETG